MEPVGVGIVGLGVVGSGTVNVLERNASEISRRAGRDIRVVRAAVRDLAQKPGLQRVRYPAHGERAGGGPG